MNLEYRSGLTLAAPMTGKRTELQVVYQAYRWIGGRLKQMVDAHISPGYYPDPENPGVERWWNGQGWSDARRYPSSGKATREAYGDNARALPPPAPGHASSDSAWAQAAQSFTEAVNGPGSPESDIGNGKIAAGLASVDIPRLLGATPPGVTTDVVSVKGRWGWRAAIFTFMSFIGAFILSITTMVFIGALNTDPNNPSAFSVEGTPAFIFFIAAIVAFFSLIGAVPAGIIAGFVRRKPVSH